MPEISRDFRSVTPIQNYNPKPMGGAEYSNIVMRCEDCPAAEVCKKIGNFRASCDPKGGKRLSQQEFAEKCAAGTNILLWRLLEVLSRER
ncbi:MAG: hypothetical protein DKM50_09930 [Candidatus Margulisiibacteriota bacterium]|nr:MAG: hypothetical protein A2X43_04015 [Candidatus Margulisbacteria bacterium GWD2_39_127]OGI05167.1 MAG: hypothetical protein A2X42_02525 [Candidatus Margulisbacteria bacterium GWF2_38_17]OGI06216.1 MAG: hypothetical protein A2X41_08105 [Candidatus Margulisbacteria bacterium GWE2_39_32]PZM78873.1 MAG: hypothetical protein DKM50_09930 [Candidatus Margulisiibacteriota bacterium]HAR64547.1 hypothetical protein [Candidatus Margulisiibacteriota bacterium]